MTSFNIITTGLNSVQLKKQGLGHEDLLSSSMTAPNWQPGEPFVISKSTNMANVTMTLE